MLCQLMLCSIFHYCLYVFLNTSRIKFIQNVTLSQQHIMSTEYTGTISITLIYNSRLVMDSAMVSWLINILHTNSVMNGPIMSSYKVHSLFLGSPFCAEGKIEEDWTYA